MTAKSTSRIRPAATTGVQAWRWEPMQNVPDLVVPFKRDGLCAGGEGIREVREAVS